MSPPALPPELVLAIARRLPDDALPALALTSPALADAAHRVLYRHLVLAPASRNITVVALLARKHSIARHVRSFYIALDPAAPIFARFYSLLAVALKNMSALVSLHLLVDADASWILPHALALPNLVHFTSSFTLDRNVARFLALTPALRQLELDSIPTLLPTLPALSATSIPRLDQFIGSSHAASLIVPGRPVTGIHLNTPLADDDMSLLARSTLPILVLSVVIDSSPIPFLHHLHRHLPHLAYLRIMSTQNLCQPPSPEFYEQVTLALGSFPQLNAFELSGIHWCSQRKHDHVSKRVWQSSPLLCTTLSNDDLLLSSLAY